MSPLLSQFTETAISKLEGQVLGLNIRPGSTMKTRWMEYTVVHITGARVPRITLESIRKTLSNSDHQISFGQTPLCMTVLRLTNLGRAAFDSLKAAIPDAYAFYAIPYHLSRRFSVRLHKTKNFDVQDSNLEAKVKTAVESAGLELMVSIKPCATPRALDCTFEQATLLPHIGQVAHPRHELEFPISRQPSLLDSDHFAPEWMRTSLIQYEGFVFRKVNIACLKLDKIVTTKWMSYCCYKTTKEKPLELESPSSSVFSNYRCVQHGDNIELIRYSELTAAIHRELAKFFRPGTQQTHICDHPSRLKISLKDVQPFDLQTLLDKVKTPCYMELQATSSKQQGSDLVIYFSTNIKKGFRFESTLSSPTSPRERSAPTSIW